MNIKLYFFQGEKDSLTDIKVLFLIAREQDQNRENVFHVLTLSKEKTEIKILVSASLIKIGLAANTYSSIFLLKMMYKPLPVTKDIILETLRHLNSNISNNKLSERSTYLIDLIDNYLLIDK